MSTAFTQIQAVPVDAALPYQNTGTAGKALISNGTNVGWNTVLSMVGTGAGQTTPANLAAAILPIQTGQGGKVLSTDGSGNLSWVNEGAVAPVAITNGGTGATTASQALTNLGAAATSHTHSGYAPIASPSFTGTPVAPTATAGTNTTQVATTAFVNTAITSSGGLGVGQTWQNMLGSRAAGSSYTNSTSKPIAVSIAVRTTYAGVMAFSTNFYVDGVLISYDDVYSASQGYTSSTFMVVPVGSAYVVTVTSNTMGAPAPSLYLWTELR